MYFARIAALIKELDLKAEDLGAVRADAHKVAAYLGDVDPGSPRKQSGESVDAAASRQSVHEPSS